MKNIFETAATIGKLAPYLNSISRNGHLKYQRNDAWNTAA